MKLRFYNSIGDVKFNYGTSEGFPFKLTAIDGLALTDKTFDAVTYYGIPGQYTVRENVGARTITMSGDVPISTNFRSNYAKALNVLNAPGTLEIHFNDGESRMIDCRCTAFTPGERHNIYQVYVVQFVCDYPYFKNTKESVLPMFSRQALFNSSFTFPGKLSTRLLRSQHNYIGSVKTEPVIKLITTAEITGGVSGKSIKLQNHTTGAVIELVYTPDVGEVVTIDVPKRTIYNNSGTVLTANITDDTFLDKFYLIPGINDIESTNYNTSREIVAEAHYFNQYVEAVY